MEAIALQRALTHALADRQLLTSPFYTRWQKGELAMVELSAYAGQYRHFEAMLPAFLTKLMGMAETPTARALISRNLADEAGYDGIPHLALFDGFARAVDGPLNSAPSPATAGLLAPYEEVGTAAEGLAALYAYESQAPAIAASKGRGLREHYGLTAAATEFWDVHAELDADHAAWALEALAELVDSPESACVAARRAADGWWDFLAEREAERPTA